MASKLKRRFTDPAIKEELALLKLELFLMTDDKISDFSSALLEDEDESKFPISKSFDSNFSKS